MTYECSVIAQTPSFRAEPKPRQYDNRLCDDILRQAQKYARRLCKFGGCVANGVFKVDWHSVKL